MKKMHDHHSQHHYQAGGGNRQEYLFHPNRSQALSHHHQQQQQHHSASIAASEMRTPVAWTLRDATLSHPRSPAVNPGVPFATHQHQHQLTHAFDSISLRQASSSISGRDQPPPPQYRIRHSNQQQVHHHPYQKSKQQQNGSHRHQRTSSPSATTTSSDDRDEIPIVRHPHRRQHGPDGRRSVISRASHMNHGIHHQQSQHPPSAAVQLMHHHPSHAYQSDHHQLRSSSNPYGITMGTLRSTKSVPSLALHRHHQQQQQQQQHDNCPVHGHEYPIFHPAMTHQRHPTGAYSVIHAPIYADRRMLSANSVMDLRSLPPLPPSANQMQQPAMITNFEAKKLQTAIQLPLPQGMYPGTGRHMMMPQSKQLCSPMDLYSPVSGMMPGATSEPSCCKGHLIVLWIILSVVMLGVISGIILGVTMN